MPNIKREAWRTKSGEEKERWRLRIQRKDLRLDRCFQTRKEAEDAARAASTPQGAAFLRQEQEALSREHLAAQEAKRLILARAREKTVSEVLALFLRKRYGYDPRQPEKPLSEMTDQERRRRSARVSDQARIAAFAETHLPIERDEAGRIARVGEAEGLAAFLPDGAKPERIGSLLASDLAGPAGEAVALAYIQARKETVGERSKKPISLGTIRREINVFRSVWGNLPLWVSGASAPKSNPFAGKAVGKSLEGANAERDRRLSPAEIEKVRAGMNAYSNPQVQAYALLLLFTGMRRGEVETTTWGQIEIGEAEDGEKRGQILLRPDQTKKKRGRAVWLPPEAIALLEAMGRGEPSEKVFSIKGNGVHQAFRKICRKAGVLDFRLHDLRAEFVSSTEERFPLLSPAAIAHQVGVGSSYLEKRRKGRRIDAKDGPTSPEALRRIAGHASEAAASPYQRGINVEAFRNAFLAEGSPLAVPVVVEDDESGGSLVECPDLGLSLAAASEDEALALMRQAIERQVRKGVFPVSSGKEISRKNPGKIVSMIQIEGLSL